MRCIKYIFFVLIFHSIIHLVFILKSLLQNIPFIFRLDLFFQNEFPLNLVQVSNVPTEQAALYVQYVSNSWPIVEIFCSDVRQILLHVWSVTTRTEREGLGGSGTNYRGPTRLHMFTCMYLSVVSLLVFRKKSTFSAQVTPQLENQCFRSRSSPARIIFRCPYLHLYLI